MYCFSVLYYPLAYFDSDSNLCNIFLNPSKHDCCPNAFAYIYQPQVLVKCTWEHQIKTQIPYLQRNSRKVTNIRGSDSVVRASCCLNMAQHVPSWINSTNVVFRCRHFQHAVLKLLLPVFSNVLQSFERNFNLLHALELANVGCVESM